MNATQRTQRAKVAAHVQWAKTADRTARTANLRAGFEARFERLAREMHPDATDKVIAEVAASLRKAHFARMHLNSAKTRAANKGAKTK